MSIYKKYSNRTKCMYFMTKDEESFDKCMAIWEKISNVIKKILIVNLYVIKSI